MFVPIRLLKITELFDPFEFEFFLHVLLLFSHFIHFSLQRKENVIDVEKKFKIGNYILSTS